VFIVTDNHMVNESDPQQQLPSPVHFSGSSNSSFTWVGSPDPLSLKKLRATSGRWAVVEP